MPPYQRPLLGFVLFNLIALPLLGRLVWMTMLALNTAAHQAMAILLSVVVAFTVLASNIWLTQRARRAGLPAPGPLVLWLITVATFALTIGFGTFSPINLLLGLLRT